MVPVQNFSSIFFFSFADSTPQNTKYKIQNTEYIDYTAPFSIFVNSDILGFQNVSDGFLGDVDHRLHAHN